VANQIHDRFKAAGKPLNESDIAILDAAEYHHYQVCPILSCTFKL
jgi:eukaryotic sulfide quinone oxidoreductase